MDLPLQLDCNRHNSSVAKSDLRAQDSVTSHSARIAELNIRCIGNIDRPGIDRSQSMVGCLPRYGSVYRPIKHEISTPHDVTAPHNSLHPVTYRAIT